jgi:hypothetical protein
MTAPEPEQAGALVCDFGRGSREQSQGLQRKDDVHPLPKAAEAAAPPS